MNEPNRERESEPFNSDPLDREESQKENLAIRRQIETSYQFIGPLPPPGHLEQYNRVLPNAADRIISMAEREQEHRHKMQEKLVDAQISDTKQERHERRLGQIFGLTIGVVSIVAGSVTAILGAPFPGTFIGVAGVGGLVSVFVLGGRKRQDTEYPKLESSDLEDETE